ncbi:hypothetical protein [Micromonospora parva]
MTRARLTRARLTRTRLTETRPIGSRSITVDRRPGCANLPARLVAYEV